MKQFEKKEEDYFVGVVKGAIVMGFLILALLSYCAYRLSILGDCP